MSERDQHDANTDAARMAARLDDRDSTPLPPEAEAAWTEWSKSIQRVGQRTMTLLRAAFEAGYASGVAGGAASTGREGGKKGGRARAANLSKEQRSEIAKKAARTRWGYDDES